MTDWLEEEKERKYHEVTKLFPLMEGAEFEALKADILENGLLEAIWLHSDSSVIDGRNRHRACVETGVQPRFMVWRGGSLVKFVISVNLHRRHLSASQRACVAIELLPALAREARKRQGRRTDLADNFPQKIAEGQGEAREQAAQLFGTNRQYISDAKKLYEEAPDLFQQVKAGILSIPKAIGRLKGQKLGVHFSSESSEWLTPPKIIECVLRVLGQVDLDPCSNSSEEPNIPATQHLTIHDDGLTKTWQGRVYMNPPYGTKIGKWVGHLLRQFETGEVTRAIALLPSRTDTRWFRALRDYPRCFIWGRLHFGSRETGAPFPSMAVYLWPSVVRFAEVFSEIGDIYVRLCNGKCQNT